MEQDQHWSAVSKRTSTTATSSSAGQDIVKNENVINPQQYQPPQHFSSLAFVPAFSNTEKPHLEGKNEK